MLPLRLGEMVLPEESELVEGQATVGFERGGHDALQHFPIRHTGSGLFDPKWRRKKLMKSVFWEKSRPRHQ